ncbi:restriction endonuclease subunit S [Xanthomonas melonis]|uniref:Restriction endonuclease subunit S n=1 Tax=Xanthomonas melonis TaxID=56456 RepID=A0ABS8P0I6_9XANT|nr:MULTISPECIES: restriction endonuclease subunit S [Xanthomonas]MCC4587103.1 restriction endonuclease subunit S [Xanthomonas sp. NCPPB 1067]MCD0245032.1 restriction endonuclease subunit S [Xanthomonas melonis]MCD0258888.1 restriction endonuclease subunit S [Xanthomonas melonis]MCD0267653.1 restriction endonuclease subunit S [Xanthomonas melonis]
MELNERGANYLYGEQSMTVLGLIPSDWSVTTVGDEFHVQLGKMLDSEKNMGKPKLFLGNRAVQWGRIDINDIGEILMSRSDLQRYRLEHGDLLVCEGGEVGRSAIWRGQLEECYYQKALHRLRTKRGYSHEFMAAVLEQFARTGKLQNYVTQTSIAHLPKEKLVALPIPKPASEDEQYRISQAICDADALIESLEQLLTKKRQIKQGAMQELLTGKRRLPGFNGSWSYEELRTLVQAPVTDGPHTTPVFVDSGVPFLSVNNLVGNRIDLRDLRFITREDDQLFARKCKPRRGDVLLGKAASVGKVALVEDDMDFNIWSPIALIRAGTKIASKFLYYQLQSQKVLNQITVLTNSSSQGNLGMSDIEKLQIAYPSVGEQREIASILSEMETEISTLEFRLAKARALKQAMAQALLTGRIRLMESSA